MLYSGCFYKMKQPTGVFLVILVPIPINWYYIRILQQFGITLS